MAGNTKLLSQLAQRLKDKKCFNNSLNKVKILSLENGNCTAQLKVEQDNTNIINTLHGGCTSTLIDVISSYALFSHNNDLEDSVSININISFIKAAKLGEEIVIEAKTRKSGRTLAFLDVEIRNKLTGNLIATGEHTKYFLKK